jgi:hypothetical protein
VEVVDGADGVVTAGFVVVVVAGGLVVVVVEGLVVGVVVALECTVVAVLAEVLDAPDEEAGAAALTATVPAIKAAGAAIKLMGTSTPRVWGRRRRAGCRRAWRAVEVPNRLARRRACRAVEVPNRLIAPPRNGNHARSTCRSFHGPPGQPGISIDYLTKSDSILQ